MSMTIVCLMVPQTCEDESIMYLSKGVQYDIPYDVAVLISLNRGTRQEESGS